MSYNSKMSSNSLKKKKNTKHTEETLEMEEVLEFKSKKRPFNPYRMRGVVVPSSWLMLDRCQCFHRIFSKEEIENFQNKLEKEFSNMMKESYRVTNKCGIHKNFLQNSMGNDQDETFSFVEKSIKKATEHALKNEPPPTMSPGIRAISMNILELLASLYSIDIPTRRSTDKHSQLLIYISDWTAKILANIYSEFSSNDDDASYSLYSPSSKLSITDEDDIGSAYSFDGSIGEHSKEKGIDINDDNKMSSSQEETEKQNEESSNLKEIDVEPSKKNPVITEIMTPPAMTSQQTFTDSVTDVDMITYFIRKNKTGCPALNLNQCLHEQDESSSFLTRCKKNKDKKGCLKKDTVKIYDNLRKIK